MMWKANMNNTENMQGYKLAQEFIEYDKATHYWTDGSKVYFRHYEIKGADIESFEWFSGCWAKDKKHCYSTSVRLPKTDPTTFDVMNYTFAKDKSNVWTMGGRIPEADSETFEVCDSGMYSLGKHFSRLSETQVIWYESFVPYGFGKDKNHVYYYDYQGKPKVITKAIPSSFHSMDDGEFAYDEKSVFCGRSVIPKANPATWKKMQDNFYYSKDGNRIYYLNRLINGADADTFEVIVTPALIGHPYQYAKDKNVGYSNDTVISHEELAMKVQDDIEHYEMLKAKLASHIK